MSRRSLMAALALGGAVAAAPVASAGQSVEGRARLTEHLDTLYPLLVEAARDFERAQFLADSLARANPSALQDTVFVGPLRIVTYPELAGLAREVVEPIWADLGPLVTESPGLAAVTFRFNWSRRAEPLATLEPTYEISAPFWRPRSLLESNARIAIGSALGRDIRGPFADWTGTWSVSPPARPGDIYRALMTTPSKANRACAEGDGDACWAALGLDLPEDRFPLLYTPEEARDLGASLHGEWSRQRWWYKPGDDAESGRRCAEGRDGGDYDSCWTFLRTYASRVPTPLGYAPRQSLVWVGLQLGGEGAFDRLVADPDATASEAILAASGASREELITSWHDWVMSSQPHVYAGLATRRRLAFFWFLVFGLLALRSTRWRLG